MLWLVFFVFFYINIIDIVIDFYIFVGFVYTCCVFPGIKKQFEKDVTNFILAGKKQPVFQSFLSA